MKRKTCLVFDDPESMTGDDYVTLTGLRKCYFDECQGQEALNHALLYF